MRIILSIFLFVLFSATSFAQGSLKIKDLEKKRKAALEQIAGITKQLNVNKKDAASSLKRLKLIATQIESRKKLIQLLNDELAELESQITTLEREIDSLEGELNQKKDEYGKSVQLMYLKRTSYDKLMFVFSSNSLSQAYRRARYLKEYAVWSRQKGEEIIIQQAELNRKKAELQKSKSDKEMLLTMRQQESNKLKSEEVKQKGVVKTLDKKRGELQTTLVKQKKQAQALDQQIQRIIQEEVRRAQEEARKAREEEVRRQRLAEESARRTREEDARKQRLAEEAKANKSKTTSPPSKGQQPKTTPKATEPSLPVPKVAEQPSSSKASSVQPRTRHADTEGGYAMTKEEKNLSDNFSSNRGSLPIPVTGRFKIVGHFGQQQHEDLKYVVTNNNGVDIQGEPGADARAIFGGVVSKVFAVPGYNSSVIIRHGNFLSVYSNLSRVYVSAGEHISTRQAIGKIYSDADFGNQTVLHFQIWKETTKQNPENWINF
ncbi:MAG: peptidoglycan DD-metalloendopeptidase family protein [Bacteroidales bacterium]